MTADGGLDRIGLALVVLKSRGARIDNQEFVRESRTNVRIKQSTRWMQEVPKKLTYDRALRAFRLEFTDKLPMLGTMGDSEFAEKTTGISRLNCDSLRACLSDIACKEVQWGVYTSGRQTNRI